jgi:DNA polymerase
MEELIACNAYLDRQILAVNPGVIVTLGRFSMTKFFPKAKISEVHGNAFKFTGRLIIPMYHPAAALHQPSLRSILEADFDKLPGLIAGANQIEERNEESEIDQSSSEQLRMF